MTERPEPLVFTLRPGATSLWLTVEAAEAIGARHGHALTPAQMAHPAIVELLAARVAREGQRDRASLDAPGGEAGLFSDLANPTQI